jgi:hypothetical protein
MILFAEDWQRYPTASLHLETTNKSFVRLAAVYREMKIDNHAFILALVNPQLRHIDPFDENLTTEQMAMVAVECQVNPWYFFREVARAPAIAGVEVVSVEANRGNIALWWCFFNHVMITLIQPRQTGKSFSTDGLMTYLMNVVCQNTQINLMTKDDVLRRKNVERVKEIMEALPRYMYQRTRDDAANTEEITIRRLGNTYTTHVPQASPKRAYNMGRGLTSPIFHIDEGPFQPNISIALPAALAATGAAVDRAKLTGSPYGTILTTTAGKKDDKDGKFIFRLLSESANWTELFFDAKNLEDLYAMIKRNSRTGVVRVNATFNHRQLGKTDAWLKQKLDESLQTGEDADRDYFNVWTSGTQSSPLPIDVLDRITRSVMAELHTSISPQSYVLRWYIPEDEIEYRMANGQFILGMDTSEASGGDDISFFLIDVETVQTVAVGTFNETNLIMFSSWVCDFLIKYKNVTAIIERRSTGAMLLDYLLMQLPAKGIDPFQRLFNWVVNDYAELPDRYAEIREPMNRRDSNIYVRYKKAFGFATSGGEGRTSRGELYSTTLQLAAKRAGDRVYDKSTVDQIAGLVTRNGRIDHEQGEHDDLVIGWLLCHWLLTQGKNLSFYGMESNRIMRALMTVKEEDPMKVAMREEQQWLRERITQLYDQLSTEVDDYVCQRLEHEVRKLDKQVILEEGEIYSVNELINKALENRRARKQRTANNLNRFGDQNTVSALQAQQGYFSEEAPVYNPRMQRWY